MKKIIYLSAMLILSGLNSFSQTIIGKMYIIVPDFVTVYRVDEHNQIDTTIKYRAKGNTKFTVTGFDRNNNIKISFWRYGYLRRDSADGELKRLYTPDRNITQEKVYDFPKDKVYIREWADYKEFAIKPEDFNTSCIVYYGTKKEFTWGVMTLPIKARFGNKSGRMFSFEEKLNLGFVAGMRYQFKGTKQHALNVVGGFGIANVRTDSLSQKSGISPSATSAGAFSTNIGVLYSYENFQIGAFTGLDYIPGALGNDWRYQGKPWLGLAIGMSLFSRNETQGGEGHNKE